MKKLIAIVGTSFSLTNLNAFAYFETIYTQCTGQDKNAISYKWFEERERWAGSMDDLPDDYKDLLYYSVRLYLPNSSKKSMIRDSSTDKKSIYHDKERRFMAIIFDGQKTMDLFDHGEFIATLNCKQTK